MMESLGERAVGNPENCKSRRLPIKKIAIPKMESASQKMVNPENGNPGNRKCKSENDPNQKMQSRK